MVTAQGQRQPEPLNELVSDEDVAEITKIPPEHAYLRRAGNTLVQGGQDATNSRIYFIRPIRFDEEDLERTFVLKVLPEDKQNEEKILREFKREIKILELLNCANFPKVYCHGEGWMLMDYFAGNSLSSELLCNWLREAKEAREYLLGSARLIHYLHTLKTPTAPHGISHRDIKPAHIIKNGDRICLIDFGISRINGTPQDEEISYTGEYAPPEVKEDRENGTSAPHDVFAFARTCVYTLTGALPPNRKGLDFKASQITGNRFQIPERLAQVVNAGLADRPEDRPRIDEFTTALSNWELEEKPKRNWFTFLDNLCR